MTGEEAKELAVRKMLVLQLIIGQLYRKTSWDLTNSDILRGWAATAKKEKNKQFINLQVPAAQCIRTVDAWSYQLSRTITKQEFSDINHVLSNESMYEMLEYIIMVQDATAETIAMTNEIVRKEIAAAIERQSQSH